ncbi:MAG: dephospho-CoA kinase [Pseudomonadota bacterium]
MSKAEMKKIGLTGNIGTGKSTVSWMFGELGVPILDADEIAHEALKPQSAVWKAVYERYGGVILLEDGTVNREAIARIVFQDLDERKFLESQIHPYVKREIEKRMADLGRNGHAFAIAEIPLLYEARWESLFDAIIVVRCNEEQEIERCEQKFGMSRDEVLLRLGAQYPLERKVEHADVVIENDGPLEETEVQVKRLHKDMVQGKFPRQKTR